MIDKTIIENQFFSELKFYLNPSFEKVKTLDANERQKLIATSKKYYQYLADNGISYGKLALEIVNNEGNFGLIANSHLKHQCVFDGIKAEKVPTIRERIIISLAYHDMILRKSEDYDQNSDVTKDIEDYHISVFTSLATVYAWGGLAFSELMGTGSWLTFYEQGGGDINALITFFTNYKESKKYSTARLIDSLIHDRLHYHTRIIGKSYVDDAPFSPIKIAVSRERLAKSYGVPESRVERLFLKFYRILPALDNPINHENFESDAQTSGRHARSIESFRVPIDTDTYRIGYEGASVHRIPIDHVGFDDVPLISNDSSGNVASANAALNVNSALLLANLVLRTMAKGKQDSANADTSGTRDSTVEKVTDYGHAQNLAYSAYIPDKHF